MSWTWTGTHPDMSISDRDPVFRFNDNNFFTTGRNAAEARFWRMKIHEEDRRGLTSSIDLTGSDGESMKDDTVSETKESTEDVEELKDQEELEEEEEEKDSVRESSIPREYHDRYSYDAPSGQTQDYYYYNCEPNRERSMSVVSTRSSRYPEYASNDYKYSYQEPEIRRISHPKGPDSEIRRTSPLKEPDPELRRLSQPKEPEPEMRRMSPPKVLDKGHIVDSVQHKTTVPAPALIYGKKTDARKISLAKAKKEYLEAQENVGQKSYTASKFY